MSIQQARRRRVLGGDIVPDTKDLRLFMDARYGVTVDSANRVSHWENRVLSPDAQVMVQAVDAQKPTLFPARRNSHPAVVFDGTTDSLAVQFAAPQAQPMTIIVALKSPASSASNEVIYASYGSGTHRIQFLKATSDVVAAYMGAGLAGTPSAVGGQHIFSSVYDGANSIIYEKGVSIATGNIGSNLIDGIKFGKNFNDTDPGDMDLYCFLLYTRVLPTSDIRTIEKNIAAIWDIPL